MSAILGLADLSRDERVRHGRAPQPELDYITQAAGQLWVLVNNLLDLSRADGPSVASPATPGGPREGPARQPGPPMGNAVVGVTRSEARSSQEACANGAPRMRVLIIDDDPATRFLLCCCLPQTDFDVTEASDGEEGLASAAANPPDIVILDLLMPGMPGGDVLAALRADPATHAIPVVVATAGDLDAGAIRALRQDAAAIISKSELTPATLPRTLRAAAGPTP